MEPDPEEAGLLLPGTIVFFTYASLTSTPIFLVRGFITTAPTAYPVCPVP
jgi:hypothetical protein